MAEKKLTELSHAVQIFDPRTGLPTKDFLQAYNALVRRTNNQGDELDDHETRISDLEP